MPSIEDEEQAVTCLPADLAASKGRPKDTTWGLFGDTYQLGTLNFLTSDRVLEAARLIRTGARFNLNLPLNRPPRDASSGARGKLRGEYRHEHVSATEGLGAGQRDEIIDNFNTQTSTQWDGLAHVRHPRLGNYNGVSDEDICPGDASKLSIGAWVEAGSIIGRGVVVDVQRFCVAKRISYDPHSHFVVSVDLLKAILEWEGIEIRSGDILLVRTGAQEAEASGAHTAGSAGLGPGREMGAFLWAKRVAAVASDTGAFEPSPIEPSGPRSMHMQLIPMLGMPIGELFALDALAAACAEDGIYESMFVSVPLNLPGGVASPANAMAIR